MLIRKEFLSGDAGRNSLFYVAGGIIDRGTALLFTKKRVRVTAEVCYL